jgi:hypothetical protein
MQDVQDKAKQQTRMKYKKSAREYKKKKKSRWEATFSAPVQTGSGAHPATCTMTTEFLPGENAAGALTTHTQLASRLKKE